MRLSLALASLFLTATIAGPAVLAAKQPDRSPMVIVISLDAFAAESLKNPDLPAPTLHALMRSGSYADSMRPINPTVTWPNHTAMVTGVNASRHHVIVNGLIVNQRLGEPHVDSNASKSVLVAVPTVYDIAHVARLTTAEVNWVAINEPGTIDWSFAENPSPASPIVQDLLSDGTLTTTQLKDFHKPAQAWRDRMYTAAAIDIIRRHHPNLALIHLLALDGIEHKTGYGNDSGINTIAFLDDRVKEIVDAVRAAGDIDRTTFLIVSDHGQQSVHHQFHPNVLLRSEGLQGDSAAGSPTGETFCMNDGGFSLLFQQHATQASIAALRKLFVGRTGVRGALTPQQAAAEGWPIPSQTTQAPDLLLYADDDFALAAGNSGPLVTDNKETGQHGYPNSLPLMQAIFIASGRGIRNQGRIASISNLDVAPTIARLLNLQLENIEGHPLEAILK